MPNSKFVDMVFDSSGTMKPGSPVSIVFYLNAQPVAVSASVAKQSPLTLATADSNAALLEVGKRALLILQDGVNFSKAEAQIISCEKSSEGWRVEAGQFGWEEVDRRRYPRYSIAMPVVIKAVLESDGDAELKYVRGETLDMSLGGALVKVSSELTPGSLVEFQASLGSSEHMRALAIVAWGQGDQEIGLEFVDFLGGSRYYLHNYLSKAA